MFPAALWCVVSWCFMVFYGSACCVLVRGPWNLFLFCSVRGLLCSAVLWRLAVLYSDVLHNVFEDCDDVF